MARRRLQPSIGSTATFIDAPVWCDSRSSESITPRSGHHADRTLWEFPDCAGAVLLTTMERMGEGQRPAERSYALLAVVAREELLAYTSFRRNFVAATMEVVLDRRSGQRRGADARVTTERRLWDRRRHDITTDLQTA